MAGTIFAARDDDLATPRHIIAAVVTSDSGRLPIFVHVSVIVW